jgi:uncharacterized membrane protein
MWIKIALTLSLVINLGLAGMLAGLATRSMRDGSVVSSAISALPEQNRAALRRDMRQDWRALRARASVPADARAELLVILQADEFDPHAFEDVLARGRAHLAEMGAQTRARLVGMVAQMSAEERRAYADDLRERLNRRPPPRP